MSNDVSIWRPYSEYKEWARRMGFRHYKELIAYTTTHILPDGFPVSPKRTYKDEYEGDEEFFGQRPPIIMPFKDARRIVQRLNLNSVIEYRAYVRQHEGDKKCMRLPIHPKRSWKEEWTNWGDYLGTGRVANTKRKFLPYNEAVAFVHQLNLKGEKEWKQYAKTDKRPMDIPHNPWEVYDDWVGIKAWLGTDVVSHTTSRMEGHGVVCLLHDPYDPPNVVSYDIFQGGKLQAIEMCKDRYTILRSYKYERDMMDEVHRVIQNNSTSFYDQQFTATNLHQLRFELDMMLEIVS